MGGAAAGEGASGNAASRVYSELLEQTELLEAFHHNHPDSQSLMVVALETGIRHANHHVFKESQRHLQRRGMGSTLTALVMGPAAAIIGHVGDSRAYQWRGGQTELLTTDHTWVAEQVRMGLMTAKQARSSKHQNLIMRALGIHKDVDVESRVVAVQPGDRFLLCTDGLHTYFDTTQDAAALMGRAQSPERLVWECIAFARARGGKDNVTAVVVDASA
jgi:serine/threonine protein phosphatase PrpC